MFRIAVIGAGNMALAHLQVFSSLPDVQVMGILSRTPQRAHDLARDFNINVVANNVDELYERTQADLVIVTVPELAANQVAKACFKKPWHILMEKPAGYNFEDAQDIYQASNITSKSVFVGLNRRHYSSVKIVKQELENSKDARYVHIQDQQSFEEARYFKHPERVVQNFMYANSIHNIDLFNVFCRGNLIRVNPIIPWRGEDSEVVLISLEYDSGDKGLYEGFWKGPGPWSCTVSTVSKRWLLQPLEAVSFQAKNERKLQPIQTDNIDVQFKPGFHSQAINIIRYLKEKTGQVVTLQESLKTMYLIHQMFNVEPI